MTDERTKGNGGPAFPASEGTTKGLSVRDYFAAAALTGLIASNDLEAGDRISELPSYAYAIADAMLAERAETTPPAPGWRKSYTGGL